MLPVITLISDGDSPRTKMPLTNLPLVPTAPEPEGTDLDRQVLLPLLRDAFRHRPAFEYTVPLQPEIMPCLIWFAAGTEFLDYKFH